MKAPVSLPSSKMSAISGRPSPRSSCGISYAGFLKLYRAVAFANLKYGVELNAFTTISWSCQGLSDPSAIREAQKRFLERYRKWQQNNAEFGGPPAMWIYVMENGPKFGLHTHILHRVETHQHPAFTTWAQSCVARLTGSPCQPNTLSCLLLRRGPGCENQWNVFRYMVKELNAADLARVLRTHGAGKLLESYVAQGRYRGGAYIDGKRTGASRSLDKAAQTAFFEEWEAPPDWPGSRPPRRELVFDDTFLRVPRTISMDLVEGSVDIG